MSKYLPALFLLTCSCCQAKKETLSNFRWETFELTDSITSIRVNIPNELDSFYTWVDRDDTSCGDERKYRFSDSKFPIDRESGFFYVTYPDSSYRLTIAHIENLKDLDCVGPPFVPDVDLIAEMLKQRAEEDSVSFELYNSEHRKLNNLDFYTIEFKTDLAPRQMYQSTISQSFVHVNGMDLTVIFECASKDCTGFLDRARHSLKSIEIR